MKRLFLILCTIALFISCENKEFVYYQETSIATYANDVDQELKLTLFREGVETEKYTIPAQDKMVLTITTIDQFLYIDSLHGVWGGEREFMWGKQQTQIFQSVWRYRTVIDDHVTAYSFVFTREMYEAATPINPPAEE